MFENTFTADRIVTGYIQLYIQQNYILLYKIWSVRHLIEVKVPAQKSLKVSKSLIL